ncbi:MAG: Gfo/Idh/MocA family protein [Pirellulaceae bacterium]
MDPLRVAVIGNTGRGNYGHDLDRVWLDVPGCQLVAVADADEPGRAAALQRLGVTSGYADYRQMLDEVKPDIVSIAPRWIDQHCEMVLAAAERGVHIYLEKPLCRTVAEADQMAAACARQRVKLAIAFQSRYSPKLHAVRELIQEGRLGTILELRGRGKEDARGGGEDLWVLGSHVLNLLSYFGGEPRWCFATVQQNGHAITRSDVQDGPEGIGLLAGDAIQAVYGMDDGVTGYFGSHRNATGQAGNRFGLQIFGSLGVVEMLTGYLPAVHFLDDPTWSPGRSGKNWVPVSSAGLGQPEPLQDGGLAAGNVAACIDLLQAIEQDRQPEANIYEARLTVAMIAAVFESQRTGGPVSFPLQTRENPLTLL